MMCLKDSDFLGTCSRWGIQRSFGGLFVDEPPNRSGTARIRDLLEEVNKMEEAVILLLHAAVDALEMYLRSRNGNIGAGKRSGGQHKSHRSHR